MRRTNSFRIILLLVISLNLCLFSFLTVAQAVGKGIEFYVEINDKPADFEVTKSEEDGVLKVIFEDGYSLTVHTKVEENEQRYYFKVIDQDPMMVYNDVGGDATYAFKGPEGSVYKVVAKLK